MMNQEKIQELVSRSQQDDKRAFCFESPLRTRVTAGLEHPSALARSF